MNEHELPQSSVVVVTSAEEDNHNYGHSHSSDDDMESADSSDDDAMGTFGNSKVNNGRNTADELYDENADDEDEAYVYKYLRSGNFEKVTVVRQGSDQQQAAVQQVGGGPSNQADEMLLLKPRHSDAVLSCPCCFNIVCMDCQRHERYSNQFRAMFVMSITVQWDHRLVYDDLTQQLVPYIAHHATAASEQPQQLLPLRHSIVPSDTIQPIDTDRPPQEVYYSVCCAHCHTQVAALDMTDEVYHFFGCLAS